LIICPLKVFSFSHLSTIVCCAYLSQSSSISLPQTNKICIYNYFLNSNASKLIFKNKKLCFNFQPCGCHPYVMLHKLSWEMHFKKVWNISFLNTSKKTLYPQRLLGVKCTTHNNSIHTRYLCMYLIFHSIIIDLLIPSPTHKYKIRIVTCETW
jgi:hypothetical protein